MHIWYKIIFLAFSLEMISFAFVFEGNFIGFIEFWGGRSPPSPPTL